MQIGDLLASGEKHDGRAPDYDDWALNADIVVYYPVLDIALELSSMGIRVDKDSLRSQLEKAGCPERAELPFQFLRRDKENIMRQDFFYVIITDGHVFFRLAQNLVDGADRFFQEIQRAFFSGNDFFPVPLVNIDGMDIVRLLVAADSAHIRVKSFTIGKTVFLQHRKEDYIWII